MSRLKRFILALTEYRPNPECLKRESYVDLGKFLIFALVTDVEWIRPAIAAFQFPTPGKLNVFAPAETASARRRICAAYCWWSGAVARAWRPRAHLRLKSTLMREVNQSAKPASWISWSI